MTYPGRKPPLEACAGLSGWRQFIRNGGPVQCNSCRGGGASRSAWLPGFSALMRPLGTFRWATPLVALVLLVAAVLKAHQLATEPVVGSGLLDSRWLLVAVVQHELFLAFWLLSGLFPRTACCFGTGGRLFPRL